MAAGVVVAAGAVVEVVIAVVEEVEECTGAGTERDTG